MQRITDCQIEEKKANIDSREGIALSKRVESTEANVLLFQKTTPGEPDTHRHLLLHVEADSYTVFGHRAELLRDPPTLLGGKNHGTADPINDHAREPGLIPGGLTSR